MSNERIAQSLSQSLLFRVLYSRMESPRGQVRFLSLHAVVQ